MGFIARIGAWFVCFMHPGVEKGYTCTVMFPSFPLEFYMYQKEALGFDYLLMAENATGFVLICLCLYCKNYIISGSFQEVSSRHDINESFKGDFLKQNCCKQPKP